MLDTRRTDLSLVDGLRRRDQAAWEELYCRRYPALLAYARRRLPTTDQAREAVAETMARAVAGGDRLRDDGAGVDAWLYGILRHVVLDAQRRLARPAVVLGPGRDQAPADPALTHLEAEDRREMRQAFGRLNRADQELLELRVVAGLSAEEVAGLLGRSAGAVRMAQSRALGRLRRLLSEPAPRPTTSRTGEINVGA